MQRAVCKVPGCLPPSAPPPPLSPLSPPPSAPPPCELGFEGPLYDVFIRDYCDPHVAEDTFDAAWAIVQSQAGCNGITWEPDHAPGANAGKFTGRSSTTTEASNRGEHSYLKHSGPGECAPPAPPPAECPYYVLPDAINTAACPGDHIIDNELECELFHAWAAKQPAGYLQGALEPFVSYPDGLHPTTGNVMAGYGFGCHIQDWPAGVRVKWFGLNDRALGTSSQYNAVCRNPRARRSQTTT